MKMKILVCLICLVGVVFTTRATAQNTKPKQTENKDSSGVDFSDWILMQPTGAEAEFKTPVKTRYTERTFTPVQDEPPIKVRLYKAFYQNRAMFQFGYHDLHVEPTTQKKIEETLNGAVRGSYVNVAGAEGENQPIRYGKYPGREFTYAYIQNVPVGKPDTEGGPPKTVAKIYVGHSRILLVNKRQYQMTTVMEKSEFDVELSKKFLNTFRIVKPDSDLPPKPKLKPKNWREENESGIDTDRLE